MRKHPASSSCCHSPRRRCLTHVFLALLLGVVGQALTDMDQDGQQNTKPDKSSRLSLRSSNPSLDAKTTGTTGSTGNVPPLPPRACAPPHHHHYPFCNASLGLDARIDDLIDRLTLDEKPLLLTARHSPLGGIPRLGIPEYDWGANCMHGVQSRCAAVVVAAARNTTRQAHCPTSFPNPNLLGASYNRSLWRAVGAAIGLELRALWRHGVGENHPSNLPHLGLDCWSPNVDILRDPRWGRSMETPSEDPLVCGIYGQEHTLGLQNNAALEDRYWQAVVTLKHFVANSLEGAPHSRITRHTVNAQISLYDLHSSYLAPFARAIRHGGAAGVMCSYNRVNGVPSCGHEYLLKHVLRRMYKFGGYITSDSGALDDMFVPGYHNYTKTVNETIALTLRAGCDVESASWAGDHVWATGGHYIDAAPAGVRHGLLEEADVDRAVRHALKIRFRLGLFDPIDDQPFWKVPLDVVQSDVHVQLAQQATAQGLVLLQNRHNVLPLDPSQTIALLGPHVNDRHVLLGNYLGEICFNDPTNGCVTNLEEGFRNITQRYGGNVIAAHGFPVLGHADEAQMKQAEQFAATADVVVIAGGLNLTIEDEGRDRVDIALPLVQRELIQRVAQHNSNIVLVLFHGGMVAVDDVINDVSALVSAGYPGRYAGEVIPKALCGLAGDAWGKLAVSWYKKQVIDELEMTNFDMTRTPGRTYRYYSGQVLFPFGYGINPLTQFQLSELAVVGAGKKDVPGFQCSCVNISVTLSNIGDRAGDEVVLAYFIPHNIPNSEPASKLRKQLFSFERVHLKPASSRRMEIEVNRKALALFDDAGLPIIYPGQYTIELSTGLQAVNTTINILMSSDDPSSFHISWVESGHIEL